MWKKLNAAAADRAAATDAVRRPAEATATTVTTRRSAMLALSTSPRSGISAAASRDGTATASGRDPASGVE